MTLSVGLGVAGPLFRDRSWTRIWHLMEKWQTLVAALIAPSAAWLAVRPVQKQLAEQRRQSAAAASTMIAKTALALEDERAAVIEGKDDLEGIANALSDYDDQSPHDIYQTWPKQAYACRIRVRRSSRPYIVPMRETRKSHLSKTAAKLRSRP
jgi:hypothetical protein